jgi:D-amino-acid dehydrogenase
MSRPAGQVIVVGSGFIGTACAYFLSRSGWQVTLLERGVFGQGCSHANCGLVCPSHVLPLATPGALRLGLKALFDGNSPLRIRPGFNWALWSWLYHFGRRCNRQDMMASAQAIRALLNASRRLYDELFETESMACDWETRGVLFVFLTAAAFEHSVHHYQLLRECFDLPAARYDGKELSDLEPALKPGLAGGWLHRTDAHLRPDRLLDSWRQVLERRGVTVRENCELVGFVRRDGRASAVVTGQGELPADAFVVATGAWTPLLNKHLGCRIPIQPGKGYSITMPRPARCPVYPLIFEEHRVVATPFQSGYRLGSMMEFAGYDATLDPRRLELLRNGARQYLHEPYCEPVEEEWFGWRPMTYDSKPIIDRSPVMENVIIAAGHNMLGLSMAPATGKLVAELLGEERPFLDVEPYSVKRF